MKPLNRLKENRQLFIIPGILLFIIVIIAGYSGSGKNTVGGEHVSPNSGAFLRYDEKSYFATGVNTSDALLAADVAFFARKNFNAYDPSKQPLVIFNLSGKPVTKDNTITFSGKYEKSKDRIDITITKLKYQRIKTSIKDLATGNNIDTLLPSNNKVNQFILSLPLSSANYSIYYSLETNKVTVSLNFYSNDEKQAALSQIAAVTSPDFITDDNIDIFYASSPPGVTDHVDYIKGSIVSR